MKKVTPHIEVSGRIAPMLEMKLVITPSSLKLSFNEVTLPLLSGDLEQVLGNIEELIKEMRVANGRLTGYEVALEATDRELDNLRFRDTLNRAIGTATLPREAAERLRLGGAYPVVSGQASGSRGDTQAPGQSEAVVLRRANV